MKGADEYYDLFGRKSQQIGRLYFQLHEHARGKCFEIFLVPEGVEVTGSNIGGTEDAVEVYGLVSGQRGWTETYGWIHKGKWQDDFEEIVAQKKSENEKRLAANKVREEELREGRKSHTGELLSSY